MKCEKLRLQMLIYSPYFLFMMYFHLFQRQRRLYNIANELMTTEEQYVKRLGVLVIVSRNGF